MVPPRFLITALLALVLAAPAAGGVELTSRDEPLGASSARVAHGGERVLAPRTAKRFNLVGLHWRGSGDVWFRTAPAHGSWGPWRHARPEAEDLPDTGTDEAASRRGWTLGNPWWTGTATRIQYRVSGGVTRLRAHFVWSPITSAPSFRVEAAQIPLAPDVITRAEWGADESIVRDSPSYADRVALAFVHHTAGAAPTSPAQSAASVRGIQAYHVHKNGWDDIGYNFLVDPFGQIFEGRAGGITRNVIGAHAQGFNTGSVGISLLGNYDSKVVAPAASDAIAALLAWRLDLAHVDPASTVTRVSAGSNKWAAGTAVPLRAVSGHRDVGQTACPGAQLYAQLSTLAADAASRGNPKIFEPKTEGSLGGPIRFRARLSTVLPWAVTVFDSAGSPVAGGSGEGKLVDWTWNASGAAQGRYTYGIEASGARPVREPLGGAVPLDLAPIGLSPAIVTPNGDGVTDSTDLRLAVTTTAAADVWLEDAAGGRVATLWTGRTLQPGPNRLVWRGSSRTGQPVPDGRYRLVARASVGTERVTREAGILVDRTVGHLTVAPSAFSPNGDGRGDAVTFGWRLTRAADVRLRVLAGPRVVATLGPGRRTAGVLSQTWDGRAGAAVAADGRLTAVLDATTSLGTRRLTRELVLDTRAPRVSSLTARLERRGTRVRFTLGEPARVTVAFGARIVRVSLRAGRVSLWRRVRPAAVSVAATDVAANASAPVTARVRR
jgi:hypothetical protein